MATTGAQAFVRKIACDLHRLNYCRSVDGWIFESLKAR